MAFAIYKVLDSLAKDASREGPKRMAHLGTVAGRGVFEASRRLNETPHVWLTKQVVFAVVAYLISAMALGLAGYLSADALVFGCTTIAIAASYLFSRLRAR